MYKLMITSMFAKGRIKFSNDTTLVSMIRGDGSDLGRGCYLKLLVTAPLSILFNQLAPLPFSYVTMGEGISTCSSLDSHV